MSRFSRRSPVRPAPPGAESAGFLADPWGRTRLRQGDRDGLRDLAEGRALACRGALQRLLSSPDPADPAGALRLAWDLADRAADYRACARRPGVAEHALALRVIES